MWSLGDSRRISSSHVTENARFFAPLSKTPGDFFLLRHILAVAK
jgi:hypothetical protein